MILDTHTLLWILLGDPRISQQQLKQLSEGESDVFISAACIFEITYKHQIGKLPEVELLVPQLNSLTTAFSYRALPIRNEHAHLAGQLNGQHRDPFDRILAAQSIIEGMPVMTLDRQIAELGARVVW